MQMVIILEYLNRSNKKENAAQLKQKIAIQTTSWEIVKHVL